MKPLQNESIKHIWLEVEASNVIVLECGTVSSNNLYSTDENGDVLFFQLQVEDEFQLKLNE